MIYSYFVLSTDVCIELRAQPPSRSIPYRKSLRSSCWIDSTRTRYRCHVADLSRNDPRSAMAVGRAGFRRKDIDRPTHIHGKLPIWILDKKKNAFYRGRTSKRAAYQLFPKKLKRFTRWVSGINYYYNIRVKSKKNYEFQQ